MKGDIVMKNGSTLHEEFLKELEAEAASTRKCLERIPEKLFSWKPHERSMLMGYLAQVVADIPHWITLIVDTPAIDFATYKNVPLKTTSDLVTFFDKNLQEAKTALQNMSDESLSENFSLKHGDTVLSTSSKRESISSSLNHMVHHRGQLTVYMRLNDIPVPSIYGPSADEKTF